MSKTWITHVPHFLDEGGNIPNELPAPALKMVTAICSYIAYATHFAGEMDEEFPSCFVTFNNKNCQGKVFPCLTMDEKVGWRCDTCNNNGIISGWQGSLWDLTERSELVQ